jgi:N-acetylneuraminic acid mutarotase
MQKIILLFLLPLSLFSQWILLDDVPGPARDDATACFFDGSVFAGNGRDEGFFVRGDWWQYEVGHKQWNYLGDAPFSRRQYGMSTATEDGVFVLGGILSGQYFRDFWRYKPIEKQWDELPGFPSALAQGLMLAWQDKIIAGLGRGEGVSDSLYVFDGNEWRFFTVFPGGVRHGTGHFISGNRLCVGWGKDDDDNIMNDWWMMDMQRMIWRKMESPPAVSRWWCSSSAYPGGGGVCGLGMDENEAFLNDLYMYHPIEKTWTELEGDLPVLRGANLLSDDTHLHLFWGVDGSFVRRSDHYTRSENATSSKVKLYPNPSKDFINIERIHNDGTDTWEILDTKGRVYAQRECTGGIPCTFSVRGLASGFYIARNAEKGITIKFLITHQY